MRALVLGCGSIGSRHARNLVGLGVEVTVTDIDAGAARALASSLGVAAMAREAVPAADLVVVATPTAHHVDDLDWALGRGADVFVEKPLASSLDGAARARALAGKHGERVVMVGCNLRFSEGFRVLTDNIGSVGHLAALLVDFGWWLPAWRPATDYRGQYSARRELGGGIVLDAIHEIDYALTLAGPATRVTGACAATGVLDVDVEDVADITLEHRDGATSSIHLDYLRRSYARSCTAIGATAQITWDVPRAVVELVTEAGAAPELLAAAVDSDPNAQYVREMEHLLAAIGSRSPTCNDAARAAATVEVALRARDGGEP